MSKAIYPGTFDPLTRGHLYVIRRASVIFDEVVVGLLNNSAKNPLFSVQERMDMIKEVTSDIPNVQIVPFDGLLMHFAQEQKANVVLRGIRTGGEFEYELMNAHANKKIAPEVDTLFFPCDINYSCVSSSMVRDVAAYGGEVRDFVPDTSADKLYRKLKEKGLMRIAT
ncbi:MAG: pantetheine-phosphate adenylyltransferase, partial [Eubacterium sp.]|nr:pantetheine-phosphate adenylyltransferase [Eubacterium sp.]